MIVANAGFSLRPSGKMRRCEDARCKLFHVSYASSSPGLKAANMQSKRQHFLEKLDSNLRVHKWW